MFIREVVPYFSVRVKTAHVDIITFIELIKNVTSDPILSSFFEVLVLKFIESNTRMRYDKHPHHKNENSHQSSPNQIGSQKSGI